MSKGDNARSGATGEVRGRAFVVAMIFGPAVSTAPVIRAVTGRMSRVLTVTPETIDVRGEGALSLAKRSSWRRPWVLHPSMFQAIFSFTCSGVIVKGSLSCENAGDDAARRTPWPGAYQMGDQSHPNCCMGKISLHLILLFFSLQLLSP